jgi:hypothetical protein
VQREKAAPADPEVIVTFDKTRYGWKALAIFLRLKHRK